MQINLMTKEPENRGGFGLAFMNKNRKNVLNLIFVVLNKNCVEELTLINLLNLTWVQICPSPSQGTNVRRVYDSKSTF